MTERKCIIMNSEFNPYDQNGDMPERNLYNPDSIYRQSPQVEKEAITKVKKEKKDSFGKKLGRTALIATVFGLVAGGAFQVVNIGTEKLRGGDSPTIEGEADTEEYEAEAEDIEDKDSEEASDAEASEEKDSEDKKETAGSDIAVQPVVNSPAASSLDMDVADIAATAQPSIVSITTTGTTTYQYFFQTYEQQTSGAGSGIIIGKDDENLYVATNYHVVAGADDISVGFCDGEIVGSEVKGYDEDADIAVVKVPITNMKDTTKNAVTVASIGNSSELQVGEPAIAIGNALGYGQSVTVGYISALDRSISGSEGNYIQTDAAINPGNSGGALINSHGQVIGINSVKYVDSTVEGMGFSIPINDAMEIISGIIAGNQKSDANIGIETVDIGREYSQIYDFPMGVYVKSVEEGSDAYKADLHTGDIIVEFGGEEVYTKKDLDSLIKKCDEGETVEMEVYRADPMGNYEEIQVSITLSAE